jgi:DGQHR domain-containing protein
MEIKDVLRVEDPNGLVLYMGVLAPNQIKQLTFVPIASKKDTHEILVVRTEQGYQREGDVKRMAQIKKFLSESPKSLIPPVLLSTRDAWEFIPGKVANFGTLKANDLAAVIDGQHRLGGLSLLNDDESIDKKVRDRRIPFLAVSDLEVRREEEEFVAINNNQKGVKKSHIAYIMREKAFPNQAALALMEDDESPLCNRISIEKPEDWSVATFGHVTTMVSLTFNSFFITNAKFDPVNGGDDLRAKGIEILIEYWKRVRDAFPDQWADMELMPDPHQKKSTAMPGTKKFRFRLLEGTGLLAFAKIGSKILYRSWIPSSSDIAWDHVSSELSHLAQRERVKLILQKISPVNRADIMALNPKLDSFGKAGFEAMAEILEGALEEHLR